MKWPWKKHGHKLVEWWKNLSEEELAEKRREGAGEIEKALEPLEAAKERG